MRKSTLSEQKDISRVMAEMGRKGGRIGGKRRAARMTPEQRRESASSAARVRWGREPTSQKRSQQSEADFQRAVIELAELHQWRIYHVAKVKGQLRSKTSEGFPDLVLARPGRLVFAELKLEGKDPSYNQLIWHELLRSAGEEMYVWRPADWREIEEILR